MTLSDAFLANKSENTRQAYRHDFAVFTKVTGKPLEDATLADLDHFQRHIADHFSPNTAARRMQAVLGALHFGYSRGLIPTDVAARWRETDTTHSLRREPTAQRRYIDQATLRRIISNEPEAIYRLYLKALYFTALRVSEARQIDATAMQRSVEGWYQTITIKGGRRVDVHIPDGLYNELLAAGPQPFPWERGWASDIVRRAGKRVGLPQFSAHWLRHAHCTHALENGANLADVQQSARHGDPRTTAMYLHSATHAASRLNLDEPEAEIIPFSRTG